VLALTTEQLADWNPVALTFTLTTGPRPSVPVAAAAAAMDDVEDDGDDTELIMDTVNQIGALLHPQHTMNLPNWHEIRVLVHNTASLDHANLAALLEEYFPASMLTGAVILIPNADEAEKRSLVKEAVLARAIDFPLTDDEGLASTEELDLQHMPCVVARRARTLLDQAYALAYAARLDSALVHRHPEDACKARHHIHLPRGLMPATNDWWGRLAAYTETHFTPLLRNSCEPYTAPADAHTDWLAVSAYTSVFNLPMENVVEGADFGFEDATEYDIEWVPGLAGQLIPNAALNILSAFLRVRYDHNDGPMGAFQEFLHVIEEGSILKEAVQERRGVYAMVPTLFEYPSTAFNYSFTD